MARNSVAWQLEGFVFEIYRRGSLYCPLFEDGNIGYGRLKTAAGKMERGI